jgi:hypothetical protein
VPLPVVVIVSLGKQPCPLDRLPLFTLHPPLPDSGLLRVLRDAALGGCGCEGRVGIAAGVEADHPVDDDGSIHARGTGSDAKRDGADPNLLRLRRGRAARLIRSPRSKPGPVCLCAPVVNCGFRLEIQTTRNLEQYP